MFEFAVSASLVGVLAATLLSRTVSYREEADRAAAQQLVANLRVALQIRAATAPGVHGLAGLLEENPFEWLSKKPENYLGEYYSPDLEEMPSGNWVFDRRDKTLVYLLNNHTNLYSNASNLLKFKVLSVHLSQEGGSVNGPAEAPKGVVLAQVSEDAATKRD